MNDSILNALNFMPVSQLSRDEWISVGMALKEEGYPCSVWDGWSKNDTRYHHGECERLWNGFRGNANPITGGTIIRMAKDRGWTPFGGDGCMNWNDEIEYDGTSDGSSEFNSSDSWDPVKDIITYLETLFDPDDRVGYVTGDVWKIGGGKWILNKGCYDRTAAELISSLKKHPDDIAATFGDWNREAGAWIRFNPVDGEGVKNENITRFSFALVESDSIPVSEQYALYRKLELPIAALVHSGGKSLHAIVHIDAVSYDEYRKRVDFLYDFLKKNGVPIDRQNRNPSRLSRMPGVTRNGKRQYLAAVNIGRKSWNDWMDFAEGVSDELPAMELLSDYKDAPPELPEELIAGILRKGHKMLISGSSKAGKSFLLMELCIAIAEGIPWLGFKCKKGKVLYINLEIDPASAMNRFHNIYEALGIEPKHAENIYLWHLRGYAVPLDQLVPKLIRRVRGMNLDAIIIDPIYKVITGDENNASDMAKFCNQFDRICSATGCSVIYCHHHSKGAQGQKKVTDRASGSGVFARDPDAQLDMIQLELSEDIENNVRDGNATAWRLESSLREFPNIRPVNFWFQYPVHRIDSSGELKAAYAEGSPLTNLAKSRKYTTPGERRASINSAYDAVSMGDPVTIKDLAEYLGITDRCVRDRLRELPDEYSVHSGVVIRKKRDGKSDGKATVFNERKTDI